MATNMDVKKKHPQGSLYQPFFPPFFYKLETQKMTIHSTVFSGQFCIYSWLDKSIVIEIRKNKTHILETEKHKNISVLLY